MNTTLARQAVLAVACAALAGVMTGPPASASEPRPAVGETGLASYSVPLAALGGDCLATYLARHQESVWGPTLF
jgi:hypothetical protein